MASRVLGPSDLVAEQRDHECEDVELTHCSDHSQFLRGVIRPLPPLPGAVHRAEELLCRSHDVGSLSVTSKSSENCLFAALEIHASTLVDLTLNISGLPALPTFLPFEHLRTLLVSNYQLMNDELRRNNTQTPFGTAEELVGRLPRTLESLSILWDCLN